MDSGTLVTERRGRTSPAQKVRPRPSAADIAWLGLVPAALALAVCSLALAPPLSELYPSPTYSLFPKVEQVARPEPLEATRFLFAVAIPFALAGAAMLGSAAASSRRFDGGVIALQAVAVGLIVWGVVEQDTGPDFHIPPGYFDPLLLSVPVLVLGVLIGVGLTVVALRKATPSSRTHLAPDASPAWTVGAFLVALALTALWLLPAVVTDGTVASLGGIPSSHIPIQAADYFAVVNGRTPFVDYVPQYVHLLPLAFAPFFEAFDSSLTSFSLLMISLSLVTLLALFGIFLLVTERPVAALALYVPVLAISLFPWAEDGAVREFNGSYHAFFPGRYLGPFVVAWLCALAVRRRGLPVWLLFFVAGLATLNNAEFGAPCIHASIAALILGSDRVEPLAHRIRALLVQAAIGLTGAVGLVSVVVLVREGQLPDLGSLTHYSEIFARQGYGLVPMPALGLHIALYLTFVAAILAAVVRFVRSDDNPTLTATLAFAGVFGLLTGSYFAGRSLPWQLMLLFPVWGLALALLAWLTFLHLRSTRADPGRLARSLLPSVATLIGFGVMVAAITTFPLPWEQVDRLSRPGPAVNDEPAEQRFVAARTTPGEHVLIFGTLSDHRVAERAGVVNVSPWNSILSLFSDRDVRRALDELEHSRGSKVFLIDPADAILASDPGAFARILRAQGFRRRAENPQGKLVLWQRA
jgi:hypothetical protein